MNNLLTLGEQLTNNDTANLAFLKFVSNIQNNVANEIQSLLTTLNNNLYNGTSISESIEFMSNFVSQSLQSLTGYCYKYDANTLINMWTDRSGIITYNLVFELLAKVLPNCLTIIFLQPELINTTSTQSQDTTGNTTLETTENNFLQQFSSNPLSNATLSDGSVNQQTSGTTTQDTFTNMRYYLDTIRDTKLKVDEIIINAFKEYFYSIYAPNIGGWF